MLEYSSEAKAALSKFHERFCDLDVFVEDSSSPNMYEILIERLLADTKLRARVYPLSGRESVIEECKRQKSRKRAKIFVIDGDLRFVGGDSLEIKDDRLFAWEAYCFENLLINEVALIEFCRECCVNLDKKKIKKKLDIRREYRNWTRQLFPLFIRYVLCRKYCPTEATVSSGSGRLCSQIGGVAKLDAAKVARRIAEIDQKILAVKPNVNVSREARLLAKSIAARIQDRGRAISGKDYLWPLLHFHLKGALNISERNASLKVRLVRNLPIEAISSFRDFVSENTRRLRGAAVAG